MIADYRTSQFEHVAMLYEPGISDVDAGRWARRLVRCRRCGEERRIWIGIEPSTIRDDCRVLEGVPA